MYNQVTTMEILSEKGKNSNESNSKLGILSLKDKIADALSSFMSELTISIVVTIFSLLIKIEGLKCLSGFCYHNKSKKRYYETGK